METQKVLEKLLPEVEKVGEFINKEFQTFSREKAEVKQQNDLVSYVDRKAEEMLSEKCFKIFGDAGIIREEGNDKNLDKEFLWVIDPLDGTNNFVHGIPIFSISVALLQNKKPVLGIVYNIPLKEMFYATLGNGVYLNGKKISTTDTKDLSEAMVATGFPFRSQDFVEDYVKMLAYFMKNSRAIRRMGSAAIDLAYVSAGRFDFFFEAHLKPWDVAAGSLLVQEAGGIVSDYYGKDDYIFGKTILASNKHLHKNVLNVIKNTYNASAIRNFMP